MCDTLDLALTPKTIKSGFSATGIDPFNPDIFSEIDFIEAVEQNEKDSSIEFELNEEEQRRITFVDNIHVGREEEVSTSEPSTSRPSSSMSRPASSMSRPASSMSHGTSFSSILDEIGPLQASSTPKKRSNRGRKPMQSAELTSPENLASMKEKKAAKERAEIEREKVYTGKRLN